VPFKSKKQRTYLAINEPDVYKKFKKEETMMYGKPMKKKMYGGKVHKKPMGGKVYKNTVYKKHGGAIGTGAALRGFGKGYKKG